MSLMRMSLTGAVMILAIAALRCLLLNRLPKKTFLILWWVALLRLLLPYSVPSRLSVYSIINRTEPVKTEAVQLPPILFTPVEPAPVRPVPSPAPISVSQPVNIWAIIWMIGVMVCLAWFTASYLRCRREFRASLPVHNEYIRHWLRVHKLRRRIDIRQTVGISAPLTYGVLRPVILMPKSTDWDHAANLLYVLEHEYIHIRRFDAASKLIFTAALCLHWFNPAVWLMYFLVNRDMELSCDEAVIRLFGRDSKSRYAKILIHMEETKSGLMPLANGFSKNAIEERIVAIMKTKKRTLRAAVIALILVGATALLFATSPKAESPVHEQAAVPIRNISGLLDDLQMELTPNITRRRISDTREAFIRDGQVIGGVVVLDLDPESLPGLTQTTDFSQENNLAAWSADVDQVVDYLQTHVVEGLTPADYDYHMSGSGLSCLLEVGCGTLDRNFCHFVYQGSSLFYDVWFEDALVNCGEMQLMTASVRSEDILPNPKAMDFSLERVQYINLENLHLYQDVWNPSDLQELWDAIQADLASGTMIPDPSCHPSQFHFADKSATAFENGDAPYILLDFVTDRHCLTFAIYPECENVMKWLSERNITEQFNISVVPVSSITTAETTTSELPDGPTLDLNAVTRRKASDTQEELIWDGQVIGGICLTDLKEDCLADSDCRHLHEYLSMFAPYPFYRFEYISQHGDNEAYISLKITDVETGSVKEQSHHLFEKDGAYCDFWVDNSVVSKEDRDTLFKSITVET